MSFTPKASPELILEVQQLLNAPILSKTITADQITISNVRAVSALGYNAIVTYRVKSQTPQYAPGTKDVIAINDIETTKTTNVTTVDIRQALLENSTIVNGLPQLDIIGKVTPQSIADAFNTLFDASFDASAFAVGAVTQTTVNIIATNLNMAFTGMVQVAL